MEIYMWRKGLFADSEEPDGSLNNLS